MRNDTKLTEAGRQYATACVAHYKGHDLSRALQLYMEVMAEYPDTEEADYSRTQIQNIANTVVPKRELLDAQIELVRGHLKHPQAGDVGGNFIGPPAQALST